MIGLALEFPLKRRPSEERENCFIVWLATREGTAEPTWPWVAFLCLISLAKPVSAAAHSRQTRLGILQSALKTSPVFRVNALRNQTVKR